MEVFAPPLVHIVNLDTDESFEVQINPAGLREAVSVGYTRQSVPGLSHQPLQFTNTGNRTLQGLDFVVDAVLEDGRPTKNGIEDFRLFLLALTVPPAGKSRPPRVLFVWPTVIAIHAVLASVEFDYTRIGPIGVVGYVASVTFEEVIDVRRTSETLRGHGRPGVGG